jgi:glycosyltransferase involved in cell wall biosynthesis
LVSVIIPTCDRPQFMALALEYYRRQTYGPRELVVVDDGQLQPVDAAAVERVGGRLLRLEHSTALGTKLNCGVEAARGRYCVKIDDDDYYAPHYLETLLTAVQERSVLRCEPTIVFGAPFVFFDVAMWQTRIDDSGGVPGSTLLFAREDWEEAPFPPIDNDEDEAFVRAQLALGRVPMPIHRPGLFVVVRHAGDGVNRGHTWTHEAGGAPVEQYLLRLPLYRTPERLLPRWALRVYATMQLSSLHDQNEPQWTLCS